MTAAWKRQRKSGNRAKYVAFKAGKKRKKQRKSKKLSELVAFPSQRKRKSKASKIQSCYSFKLWQTALFIYFTVEVFVLIMKSVN